MSDTVTREHAEVTVTAPSTGENTTLRVTVEARVAEGWIRVLIYDRCGSRLVLKTSWQRKAEYLIEELFGSAVGMLSGAGGSDVPIHMSQELSKDAENIEHAAESAMELLASRLSMDELDADDPEQRIEDSDEFDRVMDELVARFMEWNANDPKEERL